MKDYLTLDVDEDDAVFWYSYRDVMIAQFRRDFYNKSFSHKDQDKRDCSLRKRSKFWLKYVVKMGDTNRKMFIWYDYNDEGIE